MLEPAEESSFIALLDTAPCQTVINKGSNKGHWKSIKDHPK